jgi:hypothetical protein
MFPFIGRPVLFLQLGERFRSRGRLGCFQSRIEVSIREDDGVGTLIGEPIASVSWLKWPVTNFDNATARDPCESTFEVNSWCVWAERSSANKKMAAEGALVVFV